MKFSSTQPSASPFREVSTKEMHSSTKKKSSKKNCDEKKELRYYCSLLPAVCADKTSLEILAPPQQTTRRRRKQTEPELRSHTYLFFIHPLPLYKVSRCRFPLPFPFTQHQRKTQFLTSPLVIPPPYPPKSSPIRIQFVSKKSNSHASCCQRQCLQWLFKRKWY